MGVLMHSHNSICSYAFSSSRILRRWSFCFFEMLQMMEVFFFNPFYFTIFTSFFIFLLLRCYCRSFYSPPLKRNLPPSPPKIPIFGNLLDLGSRPHQALRDLASTHGPLMLLRFGRVPVLVASSAEMAREVLKIHDLVFANRATSAMAKKLIYNCRDVAFTPYGEYWRHMRRICVLHLLSTKMIQSFRQVREDEVNLMISNIEKTASSPSSFPVNLSEMFMKLTNDVVCRVALGKKYFLEEDGLRFMKVLKDFVELLGVFRLGDYVPFLGWVDRINGLGAKAERVAKELDGFLDKVVQEHADLQQRETEEDDDEYRKDFVDVLLQIQRENSSDLPLDAVSIKALISDMFAAGTDTTYALLEWAMSEILKHPRIMKKLQNEAKAVASGSGKTFINEEDLDKMDYLKAVIKETLRLHPPIPLLIPRESTQAITIKGFDVPAKTTVIVNAWAIGREAEVWEDPEEFKPERFMGSYVDFKGKDFQLVPFGAGRRGCPGILFAATVNELALANVVGRFDWALPDGGRAEDLDMSGTSGITIHRKFPLLAVPTPLSSG